MDARLSAAGKSFAPARFRILTDLREFCSDARHIVTKSLHTIIKVNIVEGYDIGVAVRRHISHHVVISAIKKKTNVNFPRTA
ncbi:protein of unknown function [Cupriavidus taiwanensis]|nr:protein of unknown function [Cupriavidus taiwanensis]